MGVAHMWPRVLSSAEESTFGSNGAFDFDSSGQEFYAFDCDLSGVVQQVIENVNYHENPLAFHQVIKGLKSGGTVSWGEYLTASGTHASESASATADQLSIHMRAALGGRTLNYAAGTASSSTNTVDVDSAEGSNYEQGDLVYIYDDDGHGEWYFVQGVSTDTLTLDRNLHFSAGTSDTIKGVIQTYPDWLVCTDHSQANHKTLAMAIKGIDGEDYWEMFGVKPSMEMDELTQNTAPVLRFSGMVTNFGHEALTADDLDGSPEGEAPLAVGTGDNMRFYLAPQGQSLATVEASSVQPRFGISYNADGGPNGTEGVHGYVAPRDSFLAAGLDCSVRFDDDYATDFRAGTIYHAMAMVGDGENDSICVYYPYLELVSEPGRAGNDNVYTSLSFRALQNKASAGSLTGADLRRWHAPFHIGRVA